MTLFAGAKGKLSQFNSTLHQTLHNGPQIQHEDHEWERLRDEEKRDVVEKACKVLEGSLYHAAYSVISLLVSFSLLVLGAISPLENSTWCQGFFMILAGIFTVNQSHFVVKSWRDARLVPKLDRAMHPSPEYYFLTRMQPDTWHGVFGPHDENEHHAHLPSSLPNLPLMIIPKKDQKKRVMDVPIQMAVWARKLLSRETVWGFQEKDQKYEFNKQQRQVQGICRTCQGKGEGENWLNTDVSKCKKCNGTGFCTPFISKGESVWMFLETWGFFFFSTVALIGGIWIMDVYRHTRFYYSLVSVYVACSSISTAMTFRDRMAARVYRYYLLEGKRAGDKITTYIMTNVLRAIESSKQPAHVFQIIIVVSGVMTLLALLLPSEGSDPVNNPVAFYSVPAMLERIKTPGFWMVVVCLLFTATSLWAFFTFITMQKKDEVDLKDEFILGWFGGLFPVIGIFIVAIVLTFVAVLTMGINITEKAAIICGVLVFADATFNYFRFTSRTVDAERVWRRWSRKYGEGERHMRIAYEETFEKKHEHLHH